MNFIKKWYTYQKERFPVLIYGIYILSIVIAVFFYCKNIFEDIKSATIIPMFIVAFLQFLMVRIVDEFKDYEEDCKYRPYRPVPRGLITLKELKVLFIICIILQVGITLIFNKYYGFVYLVILWLFFALMTKSYFIKSFLSKHILAEVLLDELMMPLMVIYLSSFVYGVDFKCLWPLLTLSYLVSWIVEIARKVRCKDDEEKGVKTYTAVFGINKAVFILFILETVLTINQIFILSNKFESLNLYRIISIALVYVIVNMINILFVKKQTRRYAKMTELSANIYIMLTYLSMIMLNY